MFQPWRQTSQGIEYEKVCVLTESAIAFLRLSFSWRWRCSGALGPKHQLKRPRKSPLAARFAVRRGNLLPEPRYSWTQKVLARISRRKRTRTARSCFRRIALVLIRRAQKNPASAEPAKNHWSWRREIKSISI